jgi:hypothetical protein
VLDTPAQLIEERPGASGVGGLGAHESDELALTCRAGAAADRAFDKRRTLGAHAFRKRGLDLRAYRAHLDEQLARNVAGEQAGRAVIDGIDRGLIGEDGDDRLRHTRERPRARNGGGAGRDQRCGLLRRAIPHRDPIAGLDQPQRDRCAHLSEPGHSHMHARISGIVWRRGR